MTTLTKENGVRTQKSLWKELQVTIEGVVPLIMHNPQTVDVANPYAKAMKEINRKHHTKKTDADHERLRRLGWESSLYLDQNLNLLIPARCLYACIVAGSGAKKKYERGFDVKDDALLIHTAPVGDLDAMYEETEFVDIRPVNVNNSKVMRARPIFHSWGLTFEAIYNDTHVEKNHLVKALHRSGEECGLGDMRPRYGRFSVTEINFI